MRWHVSLPQELLLLALSLSSLTTASQPDCECFITNGSEPSYFTHHYFIDFRNISIPTSPPPNITSADTAGTEPFTSNYFNSPPWSSFWSINNATGLYNFSDDSHHPQVASAGNIFISHGDGDNDGDDDSSSHNNGTYLTLRTSRTSRFQSVAEMDSLERSMKYLSVRARLRVLASNDSAGQQSAVETGGVFGMFTYQSDTQESDLEILTSDDSHTIHCSNQPDYNAKTGDAVADASTAVGMPEGSQWTRWTTQRLDWRDGMSSWWVDGVNVLNKTKNVPSKPSGVVLNLWSDGGVWSGNMTVGREVRVGVEWIEIVYNVSSDSRKGTCHLGCLVDGDRVKDVGTPVLAYNTTAQGGGGETAAVSGTLLLGVSGLVAAFFLAF